MIDKPMSIVLQATHCCNLACKYCFVEGYYPDNAAHMNFNVAKNAIDFLCDFSKGVSIGFFGGEPLMNWDLITQVVDYVKSVNREKGPKCKCGGKKDCTVCGGLGVLPPSFHVTTNGTLLNEERVKFLAENKFSLIVSIDGPKEIHDANRVDSKGMGSYDKVMQGLELIKKYPVLVRANTLRSTFTCQVESIVPMLEHLNELCDLGYASWVSVEPCELTESRCTYQKDLEIKDEHLPKLARVYEEASRWWVDRAKRGLVPRFHNIHKMLERIFYCIHSGTECGGGVGYMSVNGLGEIFACHREAGTKIGDLRTGIDEFLRAKWIDNRIYTRIGCSDCEIKYICGGGCRQDSMVEYGDIHLPSEIQCKIKKLWFLCSALILEWCPKELIQKNVRNPIFGRKQPCGCLKWVDGNIDSHFVYGIPVASLRKQ